MYTQRDEEPFILKHFELMKSPGRFLDIGAFNGETFSTTRQLALNGWSGVCVEPSQIPFRDLNKRYDSNDSVITLELC